LPPAFACFLLGLLFDYDDGDDRFLQNVWLSPTYMALQLRRQSPPWEPQIELINSFINTRTKGKDAQNNFGILGFEGLTAALTLRYNAEYKLGSIQKLARL
jgi:hypothetical protein